MQSDFEVWPGPMEGVSRPEFVRAVNHLKLVSRWMTPFLRVSDTCFKEKKVREFLDPFLESKLPVTAQIMGTRADVLAQLADVCLACGASDINLNCGCPSKRVTSGGAGGGALQQADLLLKTAETLRKTLPAEVGFSIKMRSGFSHPDEMLYLIPRLTVLGIDKIFIHYRTVKEQYLPVAGRLERFQKAVTAAGNTPVILNGDISLVSEGRELVSATGAAGVMIARAFMQDPWLLVRFENKNAPDQSAGQKKFFETLEEFNVSGGNKLELAKMIWGANSAEFRNLLKSEFVG